RSSDLLKLKKHEDTEALVIGYKLGEGKYRGLMGSLRVRLESGAEFNIGSGFTDEQRRNPPKIGSTITFRYNGWTQNGIPKFARYLRERKLF
ncbi:DNA ligase, partial [Vibrio genomosp. F10 str. 9ZD137]